jgi:hypothetical protein
VLSLGDALEDCAAELDAHGRPNLAARARSHARTWLRTHPRPPPIARDPEYEKSYVRFEQARAYAEYGDLSMALTAITDALYAGLPYYEPGRLMLHADPALRRLRNTRGFLRINQPRG